VKFLPEPGAFPDNWRSAISEAKRDEDGKFTLCVPKEKIVAVSQEILSAGAVADITIEDVPLEDVIAELFTSQA
jgi:ABC-2 type transport system ATP-binding protein